MVVVLSCLLLLVAAGAALAQKNNSEPHPGYAMSPDTGHVSQVVRAKTTELIEDGPPKQIAALPTWLLLILAPYALVASGLAVALRPSARY
jgi:hypothetical protein